MYIDKRWIKNQIINLLFFGGLFVLFWYLLSLNQCSYVIARQGPVKTCQCKGYEIITKNTLHLDLGGEKKSVCIGYIKKSYDLTTNSFYSSEAECGEATSQICTFKSCILDTKTRTVPQGCKEAGMGWVPVNNFYQ